MIGTALSLFAILALGAAAIYISLQMMKNYKPGRTKIQKDLQQIKAELKPWINELVPWGKEEMEQLSLNQINKVTKKRIVSTSKGILTTIYHEPVIAYAYKRYVSSKENALLYARSSNHEFIYRIKNDVTEIVIDNQLAGSVDNRGAFFDSKGKRLLAQINTNSEELLLPVRVNDKEVGNVVNPRKAKRSNARAFEFMKDMGKEEEAVFLSLAVLELVKRKV